MALPVPQQASHPLISREAGAKPISIRPVLDKNPVVLVVDDDETMCETFERAFDHEKIEIISASNGLQGLRIARHLDVDVLIVDHRLPDLGGLELVRRLHAAGRHLPFILISGYVTIPVAVEAMQLGAVTVLEKPVDLDDVLVAIRRALHAHGARRAARPPAHVDTSIAPGGDEAHSSPSSTAERWAMLVLRALASPSDFRTLDAWARTVHMSRSALTECCRLVHILPRDARDFTRLLRAIIHADEVWYPEALMDFADSRTLRRVLGRAGLADATEAPTIEDFLQRQQWISADNPALAALRAACRDCALSRPLHQPAPR